MKKTCSVIFKILIILISIFIVLYSLATFTECPILSDMRTIWIETAMSTADHQWLATKFFPKSVVDEVISKRVDRYEEIGVTEFNNEVIEEMSEGEVILKTVSFSDSDTFGNKILVNDKEQGIKIVEVKSATYTGKLVFIDDPSRVYVGHTEKKGVRGKLILDYLKDEECIVGINANGFSDPDGHGTGGDIIGYSISKGEVWGSGDFSYYTTIGFDENDRLIVGQIKDYKKYNFRDAVQYMPSLIVDGKILTKCTAGWGMQPRTIVAQRSDGVVMFLVVDGRKPGYSIGITMQEAAELLLSYGAVTAGACDGGSSSVLAYNGEIINKPSTPMTTGRYLPNAFLVKKK